jgi:hypothetical protein
MLAYRKLRNPFTQKASRQSRAMLMVLKMVSEVINFLGGSGSRDFAGYDMCADLRLNVIKS